MRIVDFYKCAFDLRCTADKELEGGIFPALQTGQSVSRWLPTELGEPVRRRSKTSFPQELFPYVNLIQVLMPGIHTVRKFCEMKDIVLKRSFETAHPVSSVVSAIALVLLTGCGGVPEGYVDAETLEAYAEGVVVPKQRTSYGVAVQPNAPSRPAINAGAISSSFTLKSTEDFRGFNHEMWNGQKSWTECSCGDDVREHPRTMSWNPA